MVSAIRVRCYLHKLTLRNCEFVDGAAFTYGHFIWAGCFEVIVVLLLMAREVGISALAAGAVLLASVPLQFVFARRIGRVQASAVIHTDARTRCMQEVVSGVELIKLQAWEQPISDSVSHLRHNEVSRLKRAEVAKSANAAVFMAAPLLSALAAFATYIATGNRDLDAATAFATLAWANVALRSLIMIPRGATAASEALVSCDRVLRYLQQREAPAQSTRRGIQLCGAGGKEPVGRKPPPQAAADEGMAIVVRRASFAYAPASLDESGPESKEGRSSDKAQRQRSTSSAGDGFRLMEGLEAPVLLDIDLRVPKGALYVVVGEVAAGKSSLLSALLGDLFVVPSTDTASEPRGVEDTAVMELRGSTSYVPQRAWIANATLRKNVTFGRPFNAAKFERVVKACALEQDIARMPARERTEIGEGGTTLSGGQKQRVSLARACYAEPEVCLLDDVLSALDASVGRQVFDNVIADGGILAGSTRVMVTHALWCLPHATAVVVMRRGRIVATGPYDDLVARGVDFAALIEEDSGGEGEDGDVEAADVGAAAAASATGTEEGGDTTVIASPRQRAVSTVSKRSRRSRTASAGSGSATSEKRIDEDDEKAEKERIARERLAASGVLVAAEERDRGNVKGAVYAEYIRAGGGMLLFGVIILLFAGTQGLRVAADWWLSRWADDKESLSQGNYAWLYALFCVGYAVAMLVRTLSFTFALLRASSVLHNEMFAHVLRAPMQFFWSNPSGRILNRFSKDVDVCDKLLLKAATDLWNFATASFGSVVAVCAIMPWMLTVVIPLFGMFVCIARYYVQTSRQIKRLDAVSRSPIFQLFNDVAGADGVQSIRALHLRSVFERRFSSRVDVSISAYVAFETAARWLAVRLDSISATVALSVAVLGILLRESIGAGLLGAALAQVLLLSGMLQYSTRQAAEVESFMTSVQRVAAYGKIDTEAAPVLDGDERLLASGWPSKGRLEFRDVELRYAPHLPLALRGVSFATKPAEKIGVVGRTGGGKSTLGNAIFRIVEICGGAIVLDGTNLADIGLDAVRRSVSVIPQSPVLFSGSLRSNLDPFNEFADDAELWTALRRVHLADTVGALPAQLASRVAEGGENWSAGQRQLLCLARALLRASKVIFVDEATANVDAETDALVQRIIRNEFKSCTVVTVAHRLNTIIDSDRVLCMKDGCVANLDTPAALLADKSSLLYKLVEETGPESAKLLRKQVAAKANSLEPKEVAKE